MTSREFAEWQAVHWLQEHPEMVRLFNPPDPALLEAQMKLHFRQRIKER